MLKNIQKFKRLRFSNYDDVILLQEVVKVNPYENGWKNVREAVVRLTGKEFNTRCLREHVQYLLKLHSREDYGTRKKPGTEEEFALKEELIQQLKAMLNTMGRKYGRKRVQEAMGDGLGNREGTILYISNDFVQGSPNVALGVVDNSEDPEPLTCNQSTSATKSGANISSSGRRIFHLPRSAGGNHQFISLMKEKQDREAAHNREILSLKKQKLELEREKLQLEKEKFELERKEKEAKLEMERKELDQRILREKRQQDIIDALLSLIKKEAAG
ncbi:hypothetical protein J437_LFUL004350 [Ladona fulva]|uniref:Uncharacterized protein n=1 Tax=Ladona fulva TaxID=123851 RepID=A0A8K0K6N5_LADFU|nr:hypothetical protein J437_LFUL004350 [Ladona fulva]